MKAKKCQNADKIKHVNVFQWCLKWLKVMKQTVTVMTNDAVKHALFADLQHRSDVCVFFSLT